MNINTFTGNEKVIQSLEQGIKNGKLAHGLIIAGKKGCGVNFFARLLSADIIGGDNPSLVLKGQSPLVQTVTGGGASGQIKVESIRNINQNVSYSSPGGEKRVVIIENCENFNQNSANALLKNLEEPKDDITYILTTNNIQRLLPTIKSRCEIFTLNCPTAAQCREYFAKNPDKDTVEKLIDIYSGNIGFIREGLASPKRLAVLENAIAAWGEIKKEESYSLAKRLFVYNKKKEDFILFLQDLECIASKAYTHNSPKVLQAIQFARRAMAQNANLTLVIQNFIISA